MLSATVVDGEKGSIREYSGLMLKFGRGITSREVGKGGGWQRVRIGWEVLRVEKSVY